MDTPPRTQSNTGVLLFSALCRAPRMTSIQSLKERVIAFAQSRVGKRVRKGGSWLFLAGVVAWLAYQLSDIGWAEVWRSRPRTPWFYVLWALLYFQLPFVEAFIYRTVWGVPVRDGLAPLFRKRALNHDVASYSGEAFFFAWARKRLPLSDGMIAGTLKDNAIASSLGSWTAVLTLIVTFLLSGHITTGDLLGDAELLYVAFGVTGAAVLIGLGVYFRRTLLTLPARTVGGLFGVHLGRFLLLNYVLRILQWAVVVPEAPLSVWATMLAVKSLISRLPLIPSRDLVGTGAVLGMSGMLAASEATIAAMLLMHTALKKGFNFLFFVALAAVPDPPAQVDPPPSADEADGRPQEEKEEEASPAVVHRPPE